MKMGKLQINIISHEDYMHREHSRRFWGEKKEWFVNCVGCYEFHFHRLRITWWKNDL